jgi:antitoxin component YwqK of YwqJK toxin-antitoxin module
MYMRIKTFIALFLIFYCYAEKALGQNSDIIFYSVIHDDSVKLFVNARGKFTEEECLEYTRYVRLNNNGNFNSCFVDIDKNNNMKGKGQYVDGEKAGPFELYFPNGNLYCKGSYKHNVPIGIWNFFYEKDGAPERTLLLENSDTLLITFFDNNGKPTVQNGNGTFVGSIEGQPFSHKPKEAEGKIVNGLPDGKWKAILYNNSPFLQETFKNGKLIKGEYLISTSASMAKYDSPSHIKTFFLANYLTGPEKFLTEKCIHYNDTKPGIALKDINPQIAQNDKPKNVQYDYSDLIKDLQNRIKKTLGSNNEKIMQFYFQEGRNNIIIEFNVDKEGKAENLLNLSSWGDQFLNSISGGLKSYKKFPPNSGTMYLNIIFDFVGGGLYEFKLQLSKNNPLH